MKTNYEIVPMTTLLRQAFDAIAKLSLAEQDLMATRLLAELAAEDAFDQAITASAGKLASLSAATLVDYDAGQAQPMNPKRP